MEGVLKNIKNSGDLYRTPSNDGAYIGASYSSINSKAYVNLN